MPTSTKHETRGGTTSSAAPATSQDMPSIQQMRSLGNPMLQQYGMMSQQQARFGGKQQSLVVRTKQKMPFHDDRGIYQGSRMAAPSKVGSNTHYGQKVQHVADIYNVTAQNINKGRSTSHVTGMGVAIQHHTIDPSEQSRADFDNFIDAQTYNNTNMVEHKDREESADAYQTSAVQQSSTTNQRHLSDYNGVRNSEIKKTIASPSIDDYKVRIGNNQMLSVSKSTKRMLLNQSVQTHKHVQQVPFVEAVSNSLYKSVVNKGSRSRRKQIAQSSPSKASNADLVKIQKVESKVSLGIAAVECGHHGEKIKGLSTSIDKLTDEL